ncbi:hypothetical protein M7963_18665 [Enterobacter roggenkampii]|uniref:DUF4376 domain-containing protein n=1 Tax=Enterobacter roggenkampii TaxID=1812935 RepID=UPI002237C720|nr:hypothetical protein [Enterobacter roggenkampii]MCW5003539.1 hypothetical protein [Enterobacter roggenkampii]
MQVEHAEQPVWASTDKRAIDCRVKFTGMAETVPFTAVQDDPAPHGAALFRALAAGEYGEVAAYSGGLARAQEALRASLTEACRLQIISGFSSDALGAAHHYPSDETDQLNLSANVLSSLLPGVGPEWVTLQACTDGAGLWQYRPHTAEQIQRVGAEAKAAIMQALAKKEALFARIEAAADEAALADIAW